MSESTLYRKYRPHKFKNVIGQDLIKQALINANLNNKITHAYIFSGPRGIGKTSIARIFASSINCLNPNKGDCCGECSVCESILKEQSVDLIELDAASNNGVDQIRIITDNINYLPTFFKYKIYIIDEAHMLSTSAWNALLKTVEEPPQHVIFIFATTEYQKIPLTIISRCQRYDFKRLNNSELQELIDSILTKEDIKIDNNAIDKLIQLADGSGRDCLSILDQLTTVKKNIDLDLINKTFGLVDNFKVISLIQLIQKNDILLLREFIYELYNQGVNLEAFCVQIINVLIDYLIYLKTNDINNLKKVSINELKKILLINFNGNHLLNNFISLFNNLKKSLNQVFEFEIYLYKIINANDDKLENKRSELTINLEENKINTSQIITAKKTDCLEEINKNIVDLDKLYKTKIFYHKKINNQNDKELGINQKEELRTELVNDNKLICNSNDILDNYELAKQAFFNKDIKLSKEMSQKFKDFKNEESIENSYIDIIKQADLVLWCSPNALVLGVEFLSLINRINKVTHSFEFVKEFVKKFDSIKLVIAISKKQASNIINIKKQDLKTNIINDVLIDDIKMLLKQEEQRKQEQTALLNEIEDEE
ncbi:DNA polymerase III subunit gamma/tau [Ureaplasma parvum]|uniref:DNA polymerase III subunit gamma/tau n=1 Tax=Ureaplasma parvum TaxID=134821 RepID=UPI0026F15084|nr:DNA polymerase III subunit gamma/tau [Ureaplasma parvum]